jgi:hypothetical protein
MRKSIPEKTPINQLWIHLSEMLLDIEEENASLEIGPSAMRKSCAKTTHFPRIADQSLLETVRRTDQGTDGLFLQICSAFQSDSGITAAATFFQRAGQFQ